MSGSLGIFTGAGISSAAPATLPLGDQFHERLLSGCRAAARRFAPDAVTDEGLRTLLVGGRRNILGCIEDSLDAGTVAGVLDCMYVDVPTEEHLLCAVHAARGAMQLTLNVDNGIELAYALLTGEAELPDQAPGVYRAALPAWRAALPRTGALRVVSTPDELGRREYDARPLLVKLRGSTGRGTDGTVVPVRPALEDLESTRLDDDRLAALRAAAACDHLLITGHSGRDLDCFESLSGLLRRSAFSWVVPDMAPRVVARLRAIDPAQPVRGTATAALRDRLPPLPAWPRVAVPATDFARRYEAWWAGVPAAAGAEAYAWLLSTAGRHEEAIEILRALRSGRDGARIRLRLADALARRGQGTDLVEAIRLFGAVVHDSAGTAAVRAYALARWAECRAGSTPVTVRRALVSVAAGSAAVLLARDRRTAVRALVGLGHVTRQLVDGGLAGGRSTAGSSTPRRVARVLVVRAGLAILHGARRMAVQVGTMTRQTDLELHLVAAELRLCLLTGREPAVDVAARLARIERAYVHRGDVIGEIEVHATRGLASLARGRVFEFADLLAGIADRFRGRECAPAATAAVIRLRGWALVPEAGPRRQWWRARRVRAGVGAS